MNHVLLNWNVKNAHNINTGLIYRIPTTNEKTFITLYHDLIRRIRLYKTQFLIRTDQKLEFLKINNHRNTMDMSISHFVSFKTWWTHCLFMQFA